MVVLVLVLVLVPVLAATRVVLRGLAIRVVLLVRTGTHAGPVGRMAVVRVPQVLGPARRAPAGLGSEGRGLER
jgi:hypothetical protein